MRWCWQMFYKLLRSAGFDPGQDMLAGLDAGKEAWWINLMFTSSIAVVGKDVPTVKQGRI